MNEQTAERVAHTPGPWRWFKPAGSNGWLEVEGSYADGRANEYGGPMVCSLYCGDRPTIEADARLIAAAPELLAALTKAVDTIRAFHGIGLGPAEANVWSLYQASPEMRQINAAIAKAAGR